LFIDLLPTWGDKAFKNTWGEGPEVFYPDNARTFGQYIGNRYKDRKNIIWILGGDRNPRHEQDIAIWRAMAAGITAGAGNDWILVLDDAAKKFKAPGLAAAGK
jgi:hypothetical protein